MASRGARLLFIEDDKSGRELGIYNLEKAGFIVDGASSGEEGLALFDPLQHQVVITDLKMPGISGLEVLKQIQQHHLEVPVLVITAYGSVNVAVEAMREGAYDFIPKPFNKDQLIFTIDRALERRRLTTMVKDLRIKASGVERPIVHASEIMGQLITTCDRFAASDASVLITGESGTGKELFARRLHVKSRRAEHPFAAINCAAIPGALLESELFGHAKGAFTGAHKGRKGRFREAQGGTIFLDEVSELPIELQSKLLRAIQEKEVNAIGDAHPHQVDVRFVAATNRHLPDLIREGSFREDLYYRLNVVELELPPLRSRMEDVIPLARHFMESLSTGRQLHIPKSVETALLSYSWPGNIRELENVCERLVLLSDGFAVRARDLPRWRQPSPPVDAPPFDEKILSLITGGLTLIDLERRIIETALEHKGYNVSQTADLLGVPRHILAYRMEKYGIQRTSGRGKL